MGKKSNILIIAPHADDEILGCGGVISRYIHEGNSVYIAVMTNANIGAPSLFSNTDIKNIRAEALSAHKLLNVTNTFFFDFPAPRLETHPSYEITQAISALINEKKIDTLFIPHKGDIHKDHGVIYHAALVAARPINDFTVIDVFSYETLSETEWASPFGNDAFIPNVFIDISKYLESKLKAMSCFCSQLKQAPHPRSLEIIESLAKFRGSTVGCKYAEAFMLVRSIKKY